MAHQTGWGKAITFSWEYESSSTRIHEYYRPGLISEADWAAHDSRTQMKLDSFLRGQVTCPVAIQLQRPEGAQAVAQGARLPGDPMNYEGWVKRPTALAHWPDHLHQEGTGAKWEIAHRMYETDLETALTQIDQMLELFSVRAGALQAKPNVHVHIAFKRPNKTRHQMQVLGLYILCNNLSFLKHNMSASGLLSRHNGVVTSRVAKDILAALQGNYERLREAKDGSSLAKYNRVGFRVQPYDHKVRRITLKETTRHLVGFEIRGGFDIDEYKQVVRKTTGVLEDIGKRNPSQDWDIGLIQTIATQSIQGNEIQVGQRHIPVTVKPFMERVAVAMGRWSRRQNVPYGVEPAWAPLPVESPQVVAQKEVILRGMAGRILDRWSVGFTPWEHFPLVPDEDAAGLKVARDSLEMAITRIGMDATAQGGVHRENWQSMANKIGAALVKWASTACVSDYFSIDEAGAGAAHAPRATAYAAASTGLPGSAHFAPPPPPAPPIG